MTVCYHSQSILRSFLILNRITMQQLISRKAAIIRTWIFFIIHTLRVMQRGSSSCSLCRYAAPNLIICIWFNDFQAPSAIIIAGVFAQFRVSWFSSEISKSHRHWSSGLAIEHCFNALFWTSVGTQASTISWYLYFSSENLPGSSGSAFLQVKHAWETRFDVA